MANKYCFLIIDAADEANVTNVANVSNLTNTANVTFISNATNIAYTANIANGTYTAYLAIAANVMNTAYVANAAYVTNAVNVANVANTANVADTATVANRASGSYLQEAGGPREAQREGLGGDEEGLGVGLLGADGQRVHGPGADPGPRQAEQGVGAKRHGRVRHVVQVEHGQAQGGKTGHEGGLRTTEQGLHWIHHHHHHHHHHIVILFFF